MQAANHLIVEGAADLAHVDHLGSAERVQRELRVGRLDGRERGLVPLHPELRVVAALQHDLRRAELDSLAAPLDDLVDAAHPALVGLGCPVDAQNRHAVTQTFV